MAPAYVNRLLRVFSGKRGMRGIPNRANVLRVKMGNHPHHVGRSHGAPAMVHLHANLHAIFLAQRNPALDQLAVFIFLRKIIVSLRRIEHHANHRNSRSGAGSKHTFIRGGGNIVNRDARIAKLLHQLRQLRLRLRRTHLCAVAKGKLNGVVAHAGDDANQLVYRRILAREGIARVRSFLKELKAPDSLRPYLPPDFELEKAVDIVVGATGHIKCNPRPVDRAIIRDTISKVI